MPTQNGKIIDPEAKGAPCGKWAPVLFQSRSGNEYLYSWGRQQALAIHPFLRHIIGLERKGTNLNHWIQRKRWRAPIVDGAGELSRAVAELHVKMLALLRAQGYFDEPKAKSFLCSDITAERVKESLAYTRQVVFEVTEACNLDCAYCCAGRLYENMGARSAHRLSPTFAKHLIDYLFDFWSASPQRTMDTPVSLTFYGGEPLLNMPLIKDIIGYAKEKLKGGKNLVFNLTSNGMLLDQHMDYLVDNSFDLLLSVDGNERNHSYRLTRDGKNSHPQVMKNILKLKAAYPAYFRKHVSFNAVLHNRNSLDDIRNFFASLSARRPMFGEVSNSAVAAKYRAEFDAMFKNANSSLREACHPETLEDWYFPDLGGPGELEFFLANYARGINRSLSALGVEPGPVRHSPTGTCLPLSKRCFLSARGEILPCERVGKTLVLGHVDTNGVHLDFAKIAARYRDHYQKIFESCGRCFWGHGACSVCLGNLLGSQPAAAKLRCTQIVKKRTDIRRYLADRLSYLEEHPGVSTRILREVSGA